MERNAERALFLPEAFFMAPWEKGERRPSLKSVQVFSAGPYDVEATPPEKSCGDQRP
jgi:hypothetical protein